MNESEPDRTENTAVSRSPWKSLVIVVLILASIAMPCSTVLQLKGGSSMFRILPLLYGLWATFSLWVGLDGADFLRALGLRVDDAFAPGALALSGLGVVNLMSVFAALFMMSRLPTLLDRVCHQSYLLLKEQEFALQLCQLNAEYKEARASWLGASDASFPGERSIGASQSNLSQLRRLPLRLLRAV